MMVWLRLCILIVEESRLVRKRAENDSLATLQRLSLKGHFQQFIRELNTTILMFSFNVNLITYLKHQVSQLAYGPLKGHEAIFN